MTRTMKPGSRKRLVTRLAKLIVMCQTHRYLPALRELGERCRAKERTIRRDLEAIEEAGIPVPPRIDQYEEVA